MHHHIEKYLLLLSTFYFQLFTNVLFMVKCNSSNDIFHMASKNILGNSGLKLLSLRFLGNFTLSFKMIVSKKLTIN